jgi:hypothetical protein
LVAEGVEAMDFRPGQLLNKELMEVLAELQRILQVFRRDQAQQVKVLAEVVTFRTGPYVLLEEELVVQE